MRFLKEEYLNNKLVEDMNKEVEAICQKYKNDIYKKDWYNLFGKISSDNVSMNVWQEFRDTVLLSKATPEELVKDFKGIPTKYFYECEKLKDMVIPENKQTINDYAFTKCKNLTNISIPTSVSKIGYAAFQQCGNLTIHYAGTEDEWKHIEINSLSFSDTKVSMIFKGDESNNRKSKNRIKKPSRWSR